MTRDQHRYAAKAEPVANLEWMALRIERHDDQPHPEAGKVADNRLKAVRQQEGQPIALLQPHGRQTRRQPR